MSGKVLCVLGLLFLLPAVSGQADVRFEQKLGAKLPLETPVTDETGKTLPLGVFFRGKPVLLVFAYYGCPNLCTLVLNGLVEAMKKLSPDYDVLTLSIDPTERPPLALAKQRSYLARAGQARKKDASWHFLTADSASIAALTQAAGFHFQYDPISRQYDHPSGVIVVSPRGVLSQYFFGIHFPPDRLAHAIRDASRSKVGKEIDEILLYCFHYEPSSTRVGSITLLVIRVFGLLGVGALAGLLIHLYRGERAA
jgi:protein SCO1/2